MRDGRVQGDQWVVWVRRMQCWRVSELDGRDGVLVVSFRESIQLTQGERGCDGVCVQCGIQWAGWGAVCRVLSGAVQGEQRLIGLRGVQFRDVSEHQCGDGMRDMPIRKLVQLAGGELSSRGLPLQCGIQWPRRGALCCVRARHVQGGERIMGVFGMRGWDVPERECGDRVCGVSRGESLELAAGECGGGGVPVQCRIQWARRGSVCGMRGGGVQGDQWVVGVQSMQSWRVSEYHGGDGVRVVSFREQVRHIAGEH